MPMRSLGTSPGRSGLGLTGVEGEGSRVATWVSAAVPASTGAASGPCGAVMAAPGVGGLRLGTGGRSAAGGSGTTAICWVWSGDDGGSNMEQPVKPPIITARTSGRPTLPKKNGDLRANGAASIARRRKISSRSASSASSLPCPRRGRDIRRFDHTVLRLPKIGLAHCSHLLSAVEAGRGSTSLCVQARRDDAAERGVLGNSEPAACVTGPEFFVEW